MITSTIPESTTVPVFFFDPKVLYPLADSLQDTYLKASPFPHISIDQFLPVDAAERLLAEFPTPTQIRWLDKTHEHSKKLTCKDLTQMGPFTRLMFSEFNATVFITFLEKLTGIKGLLPDPHLEGGGLHQTERGGKLDIHADFNRHSRLQVDRRLNALLYLNKDWPDDYGGHFELWDRKMNHCVKKVAPLFNRLVIFSTSDYSFHGLPDPLNCPSDRTRKSMALYYYTNGRPDNEISAAHDTLYQARPGEKFSESLIKRIKRRIPRAIIDRLKP